jgi:hypothetical protein
VIGSALGLDLHMDEDGADLLYKARIEFFDDGPEKPVRIWSRIGPRFAAHLDQYRGHDKPRHGGGDSELCMAGIVGPST